MQKNSSDEAAGPLVPPETPHYGYLFPSPVPDEFDLFLAQQPDRITKPPRIPPEFDEVQLNFGSHVIQYER